MSNKKQLFKITLYQDSTDKNNEKKIYDSTIIL